MNSPETVPALSNQSANIPLLAIRAADELDEIAHGRMTESASAQKLGEILSQSFAESDSGARIFVKSGTVAVFCHAVEGLHQGAKVTSYNDLITRARDFAERLRTQTKPGGQLEEMKLFCIALSRAAATYRRSVHDLRPQPVGR